MGGGRLVLKCCGRWDWLEVGLVGCGIGERLEVGSVGPPPMVGGRCILNIRETPATHPLV